MVLSHNLLVRQMTELLSQLGARPAAIFASPADLRLALDERDSPLPDSGLVVCSTSVVLSPVAAKVLSTASPSLLIVDDVPASLSSALGRPLSALADRAQRVIFTDGAANAWFPASEKRIWTFPLTGNDGRQIAPEFSVRIREYPGNPTEAVLVRRAVQLFDRLPSAIPSLFFTRTAIQSALLHRVRLFENPEQVSQEEASQEEDIARSWSPDARREAIETLWRLLEDFDSLPQDERILSLIEETRSASDLGFPVTITTGLVQEADYVAAAMQSHGFPVSTVTASLPAAGRADAVAKLQSGGVLVVTFPFFSDMQRPLPNGTRNLWFRPPANRRQVQQLLGLGMSSRGVEVVLFRAVPPVTPADEVVDNLEAILENPWQGSD